MEFIKNNIWGFIIGGIIFGSIGVVAATYNAKQIAYTPSDNSWNVSNVSDAITDLKANGTSKKICTKVDGEALQVGSKYECDPGDGVKRNFYVLTVTNDGIDLIMEKNISDEVGNSKTMTWNNAMTFFKTGAGSSIKTSWKYVQNIDLPKAQAIADAVNNGGWIAANSGATWWCLGSHEKDQPNGPLYCPSSVNQQKYAWLFNYTRGCQSRGCTTEYPDTDAYPYGYWTRDLVSGASLAWSVYRDGYLHDLAVSLAARDGVRPVITLSKSNLSS